MSRPPAVAGQFYPGDSAELQAAVTRLLRDARMPTSGHAPKAIIVPHAGYIYSGPVAATAYGTLAPRAKRITRVVLIGPAHYVRIRGIAMPGANSFETPLGRVPIDRSALQNLSDLPCLVVSDPAHAREHCLEVQLPFLQLVLDRFSIVPLLIGETTATEVADLLRRLWGGEETLIVISSDLSHYYPHEIAKRRDSATAAIIESGDINTLGPENACGYLAIAGLVAEARRLGLIIQRLDLRTSGDTTAPRDHVVGYGAWTFVNATPISQVGTWDTLRVGAHAMFN